MTEVIKQVNLQLTTAVNLLCQLFGTNFRIVGLNVGMAQVNEAQIMSPVSP